VERTAICTALHLPEGRATAVSIIRVAARSFASLRRPAPTKSFSTSSRQPTGEFPLGITPTSDGTLYGTAFGPSGVTLFHYTPATGAFKAVALNFPAPNGLPSAPATRLTIGPNGNFYGLYHEYGTCCEGLFEVALDGTHLQLFPEINTLRAGSAEGFLLASDHNFWLADYNGGSGSGAIMALSPSQGTVLQTLAPFGSESPALWRLSWRADPSQDGTLWGADTLGGNAPSGHFCRRHHIQTEFGITAAVGNSFARPDSFPASFPFMATRGRGLLSMERRASPPGHSAAGRARPTVTPHATAALGPGFSRAAQAPTGCP